MVLIMAHSISQWARNGVSRFDMANPRKEESDPYCALRTCDALLAEHRSSEPPNRQKWARWRK